VPKKAKSKTIANEKTGVDDVRRVREAIARQHKGNLAVHIAETNRIAREVAESRREHAAGRTQAASPRQIISHILN
jgi:hypothetical protein